MAERTGESRGVLEEIPRALARRAPQTLALDGREQAAVAVIVRPGDRDAELLLIERAERDGDPWSGHMAFPGGRRQPEDADARATAERETLEEVGLSLAGASRLGRLDDLQGRHQGRTLPLVISAFVYAVKPGAGLRIGHEVREALWVPVPVLFETERHVEHRYPPPRGPYRFPGILVGEPERHVVWGLTYRFLEVLFEALERPFPERW